MADDEIFFQQKQVASIGGVAVGARLFYNFPLDLVVNIFIFKLQDMVTPGRLYIGRRSESARADRRVMRKKTGASTILKEIEENRDFELFSSSGHFSQSFWCFNDLNGKMVKIFIWLKGLCAVMVK